MLKEISLVSFLIFICILFIIKPSESKIQPNLECDRKLWRRHSLRINPSESDNYQTTQRNLNQFNDRVR